MNRPSSADRRPVVGLMLGDPTGVGPEVSAKLLASPVAQELARVVVVGDARVLKLGMADAGVRLQIRKVKDVGEIDWSAPGIPLIDLGNFDTAGLKRGATSAECGRLVGETLKRMI